MINWKKQKIVQNIIELLKIVDGDVIYKLSHCPKNIKISFGKDP